MSDLGMLEIVISYMTELRGRPAVQVVLVFFSEGVCLLYGEVFLSEIIQCCLKKRASLQMSAAQVWMFCPSRQSWKMCNLYEVSVSGADTHTIPFFPLSLSSPILQIFCGRLRHECRLCTVLVTVISAEQTYICSISV